MDESSPAGRHYSVGQLARMAGVSARTLRHYEDMGLLEPTRAENGYRTYGPRDVRRLSQILAMRACSLPLTTIRRLLKDSQANLRDTLESHLKTLRAQEKSLTDAIARTETAIAAIEGIENMDDEKRFEAIKAQSLKEFEGTYGIEARERYGNAAIDATNERIMSLTRDEWDAKDLLEEAIKVQLRLAMASGDPKGDEAAELARMHERWIRIHWGEAYDRETHLALVRGYLDDPRFRDYYDAAAGDGGTEFLVRALEANL
ncbi:MerR family transcriptional regulator [Olsenella uli]|uniref:MerR family transcriptional regulator n=1 Tax=Olsenella uli TaxID=133926 RepID=UPI00044E2C2A|nr:MerR family transcriptional regulator [Olsenella uli]EUB31860.1 putative transcriptional activator TipA [Olsenella uli MSTE5]